MRNRVSFLRRDRYMPLTGCEIMFFLLFYNYYTALHCTAPLAFRLRARVRDDYYLIFRNEPH